MPTTKVREMLRGGRAVVATVVLAGLVLTAACDGGRGPSGVIDRETFIETYIDLRRTALTSADGELDATEREEVLERRGVTEAELLEFADAHGRDVDFMREVWTEVEARMDTLPAPGISSAGGGEPAG